MACWPRDLGRGIEVGAETKMFCERSPCQEINFYIADIFVSPLAHRV